MPNESGKKRRGFLGPDPVAEASTAQKIFLGIGAVGASRNVESPVARFRKVHTRPDGWMNHIVEDVTERGE